MTGYAKGFTQGMDGSNFPAPIAPYIANTLCSIVIANVFSTAASHYLFQRKKWLHAQSVP